MTVPTIQVQDLTRRFTVVRKAEGLGASIRSIIRPRFDIREAVGRVSFTIEEGEFVGFLGPNGAGKTTTLKMLSGLLHPSSGTATVLGHIPWRLENAYRRRFSLVMGQKNQLWWDLPAAESFRLNKEIYEIHEAAYRRRLDDLAEMLDVTDLLNTPVRRLSLGERMKMELIAALLHAPRVLYLDEPTIGLDVVSQKAVRDFLREYNRRERATILLTSHYASDVEDLCQRVILIHHGRVKYDGDLSGIAGRVGGVTVAKGFSGPSRETFERIAGRGGSAAGRLELRPGEAVLRVARDRCAAVAAELLEAFSVTDLTIEDVPLEEVLREVYGDGDGQAEVASADDR